ncbi:hypothetical protein HUJ05_001123 [Dendroctonus ponderosae]|nr:hypothetical protein HUJ05_001123 [Dendroctonus ponderosae]
MERGKAKGQQNLDIVEEDPTATLYIAPKIIRNFEEEDPIIDAGSNYTLTCEGAQSMTWIYPQPSNGNEWTTFTITNQYANNSEVINRSILHISNMSYPFVGYYSCQNEIGDDQDQVYLYVNDPQHLSVEDTYNMQFAVLNEEVTLPCRPTSPKIKVNLTCFGKNFKNNSGDVKVADNMYTKDRQTLVSTITIKNSTLADTGTYVCRVFDYQHHSETTLIDIMVHNKNECYIEIKESNETQTISVNANEKVQYDPRNNIIKNNSLYSGDFIDSQAILTIADVQLENAGLYKLRAISRREHATGNCSESAEIKEAEETVSASELHSAKSNYTIDTSTDGKVKCLASNYLGSAEVSSQYYISDVKGGFDVFNFGPYAIVNMNETSVEVIVAENERFTFTCGVCPKKSAELSVLFNSEPLDERHFQNTADSELSTNKSVLLKHVQISDSGIYTCRIHNWHDFSYEYRNITLTVKVPEKPAVLATNLLNEILIAYPKMDKTLFCNASGIPKPTIQWFKDDQVINPSERIFFENEGMELVFKPTEATDEGIYKCEISNSNGMTYREGQLKFEVTKISLAVYYYVTGLIAVLLIIAIIYIVIKIRREKELQRQLKDLGLEHFHNGELFVIVEFCRFGNLQNYIYKHRENFIDQIDPATGVVDYNIGQEISDRSYSVGSDSRCNDVRSHSMQDYRDRGHTMSGNTQITSIDIK